MIKEFINNKNENDIKLTIDDLDKLLNCKNIYNFNYTNIEKVFDAKIVLVLIKMTENSQLEKFFSRINKIEKSFKDAEIIICTNSKYKKKEIHLLVGI